MKKSLIIGLFSLACGAVPSFGQGVILMDNYNTAPFPIVSYGETGIPANGVNGSSGPVGAGLLNGWTAGVYYSVGDVTASVANDPSGLADPSTLGGGLVLGTGAGSTASFYASTGLRGYFLSSSIFAIPGTSAAGGDTVTFIVVAYNTSAGSYANAVWRGHSDAFTRTLSSDTSPTPHSIGANMSPFSVFTIPEPSLFTFASISALALLRFRQHK